MFFEVDEEKVKQLQKELRENVGHTELVELLNNVGLSKEEETVILSRYGQERLDVYSICKEVGISESTYKRIRRSALNKIVRFLIKEEIH